jgi:hypothetical protein
MDFGTKEVTSENEALNNIELCIEKNNASGDTRLFCENGTVEELNNRDSTLYKKIALELDRLEEIKSDAIQQINESYFYASAMQEMIDDGDEEAKELLKLLSRLQIDIQQLFDEETEDDCLRKIHAETKCREIHWNQKNYIDEDFDFSGRLLLVTDPLERTWQVGNDYIEGWTHWDTSWE